MLLGYTYLNGAAPDVANQLVGLEYVSTFKFEDN
jgi:hypothetical protein